MNSILVLLQKEFTLEFRQKYAIGGVFLYVFSTVFIVYSAFIQIPATVWNVQFWLIILFAAVNAFLKSFVSENNDKQLYLYQLVSPLTVIISKLIYNLLILLMITGLAFLALVLLAGNPVRDAGLFFLTALVGAAGISIAFTFIAAIASKGSNQATLMAILGFPVIIPILLTIMKLSANALGLIQDTAILSDLGILLGLDALLLSLTLLLFPFLWKD